MSTNDSQPQPTPRPGSRWTGDLVGRIREVIDKLERDNSSRGDLKLLTRSLQELRFAFKVFSPYRHRRKVTVFGSARTSRTAKSYQLAVEFGQKIVQHQWMVITGAASGIMEAGHVGAGRENSMGLNILLPFEQDANPVIHGDSKLVHMKYFFTRKLMFVKECHAVVCLPGGFGTLDETFEVLTLLQTGKRDPMPLVLLDEPGGTYWRSFHAFVDEQLLRTRMISPADLSLYHVTESVDQAVHELTSFYRVYHSMRYVKDQLVVRLNCELPAVKLTEMESQFHDIAADGQFTLQTPLPAEENEPDLKDLPRLVFRFNRADHGRLRQLIDFLNR